MERLFLLLISCGVSSPVKHSLKFFMTASVEAPTLPELVAIALVDDIQAGYSDSNNKLTPQLGSGRNLLEYDPRFMEWFRRDLSVNFPNLYKTRIHNFMQQFNQSGGVHTLQTMRGCEWDEQTGEVIGFLQFGYDGEDLISLDLKTQTWITPKRQAVLTKHRWDADKANIQLSDNFLTQTCPEWLKKYLVQEKKFLLRTDLPSVSLLQKTPSSPVSCHATGFYPDRAEMFWRKDGEELHEDVDRGEILHNHDGTFQMRVDLNVSLANPEDWRRYDCVFQLSGLKEDVIIKLDEAEIRTNRETQSNIIPITAVVVVLALILIIFTGFKIHKKKKAKCHSPASSSEVSEKLNPES